MKLKIFKAYIDDRCGNVYKVVRPAKSLPEFKAYLEGNGEIVKIENVTKEWTEKYMCSAYGKNVMKETLTNARYGCEEISVILALMNMIG